MVTKVVLYQWRMQDSLEWRQLPRGVCKFIISQFFNQKWKNFDGCARDATFGSATEHLWYISGDFKKEDVARSLLQTCCHHAAITAYNSLVMEGVRHIFMAGGFCDHPLVQNLVLEEFENRKFTMASFQHGRVSECLWGWRISCSSFNFTLLCDIESGIYYRPQEVMFQKRLSTGGLGTPSPGCRPRGYAQSPYRQILPGGRHSCRQAPMEADPLEADR